VLRRHQPDHILLRATREDAAGGLTDIRRVGEMLGRVRDHIDHRRLDRISPLAVPVLLEIGKEQVYGNEDELLADAEALIAEAMGSKAI
jgi:ATP-dependent Lhr-like helicase